MSHSRKGGTISVTDEEIAAFKSAGMFAEKDKTHFSVRFLVIGGQLTSENLTDIAKWAKRYGDGLVHLTTRQGVEIPHVSYGKLPLLCKAVEKSDLQSAPSGPCVRSVVACPGTWCRFGLIDTQKIASEIFERFGQRKNLPHKFKIAVGGCRHCCSKPQENDLGLMGVPGGYAVFVGGMAGKTPRWADRLPFVVKDKPTLWKLCRTIINWFDKHGNPKERLGTTIERIGLPCLLNDLGTPR
jgi:dissimilatory sulfite reductase (desulfoviridin) alpha/beta subunit